MCWTEKSPTRSPLSFILDILAEPFKKGLKDNTIGSYRTAISAFHEPSDEQKVREHRRVFALMTSIFNQRPPQPKYSFMWNVETVLDYFWKLPNNNSNS